MGEHIDKDDPNMALQEAGPPDGTPGTWLFRYAVMKWMFEPAYNKQLPLAFRLLSFYARAYFKLTRRDRLAGGLTLFRGAATLSNRLPRREHLHLHLGTYEFYVNPDDPRFLQVVNELTSDYADTRILADLLSAGDTFIDVGANHGSFSIVASKLVGSAGHVVAVEPQPRLAQAVEKSLAANAACAYQVHQIALGDRDDQIELLIPRDSSGAAGVYEDHSGSHRHRRVKVPLRRFDEAVEWEKLPGRTIVKLDVEGSELAFLAGAGKMIAARRPRLIVEVHPATLRASGHTGDDLKHAMIDLGYTQYAELDTLDETKPLGDMGTQVHRNVLVMMT
jgi:FkbM family methyltransferase